MSYNSKEIQDNLCEIIEKNEDAVKGYEKAAENASEASLRTFFQTKANERRSFINELKSVTPSLQARDGNEGSTKGAIHRTWMDVKAFLSTDNDESMLEEAIRGDKAACEEYNELLNDTQLPIQAATIIRRQKNQLTQDLVKIKTMEDVR